MTTSVRIIRLAGFAGLLGAVGWIVGDALIVGGHATPADFPLLMKDYAGRIAFGALAETLPSSEPRLAAGALIAYATIPLYLIGSWHFYRGAKPAGLMAGLMFALLVCGNAWSPLGDAAFYFIGMLYKTVPLVPASGHAALLDLGNQFHRVLMIAWILPVATLALGMIALAGTIALGRTHYPRWTATLLNPVTMIAVGMALPYALPQPLRTWLHGAGINIGWLFAYGASIIVLWRAPVEEPQDA
ncbi:MAG: DUF6796 family protein [Nitrobacter sp.]|jgi:hypothetical protein